MIMRRFLFLLMAIPALALAQEKELDMEVSGLTLMDSPFEEIAGPAQNGVQSLRSANLEVTRLLTDERLGFTLILKYHSEGGYLLVNTPEYTFRYCLLSNKGKILQSAAIYSRRKWIDLSIYPAGIYFLQVDRQPTHRIRKK